MRKRKKIMVIAGIVIPVMALWLAFCGWQWSWGPFAKLHDAKLVTLSLRLTGLKPLTSPV